MSIFDEIRADIANGTPGPWECNDPEKYDQKWGGVFSKTAVYAPGVLFAWRCAEVQGPDNETEFANARRIARVPKLEQIALAAEELAKAVQKMRASPIGVSPEVHEAARKFNEATQ